MARPQEWPVIAVDVAAELRRQLDDSSGKRVELEARIAAQDARIRALEEQLAELRSALQVAADRLGSAADVRPDQWSRFWFAAWTNSNRRHGDAMLRITTLEKWLRESGEEATRLQTALSTADEEIGALTRALDLARSGERCTEVD